MQYEYSYNIEGMLESKSASGRTLLKYTYDRNNNIRTIKDITGKSSIYSYDDADRVKLIQDDKQNNLAIYDYYKNDNIKSVSLGNGLKTDYTYDGDGNVQSLVTISSNGEVLVDYNYAYDLNGNRLQKVSSKHKNFYTYDSMNRLKEASYDDRRESFTYDNVGNRLTKTTNDITEKYVYNVKNQIREIHNKNGINYFTYDKQGNTIKEETSNGNNIFEYNTLNQQVKAITKDGNTLVSRYDAEGLRAEIEENEKLTKFIFHKEYILVEADKDFNVVSRFARGYEVVAADIADSDGDSNSELKAKLKRYYYTVDEQGSTVFITDKNQQVKNEYYYDVFGNVLDSKEQVHNRITYTGQQFDSITQQYYLRARLYNPVVGRFTQEDVYRGDGLNLYAYCGNNPVGYCDPSGYGAIKPLSIKDQKVMDIISKSTKGSNIIPTGEEFKKWFDSMSKEDFKIIFENSEVKKLVKARFRAGEVHEWYKVSKADLYKEWEMKANEIFSAVTPTEDIRFYKIETKNGILDGKHGTETASVSGMAHREIDKLLESSDSKVSYSQKLINWADEHFGVIKDGKLVKGSAALPEDFHNNVKKKVPKKCKV
ncbi:hypothetical protein OD350_19190 [Clostridium beijerinckii]|uniref:RHS repeat domain-containing protein n=1 Tax=Clostridium beijerinckii TaxID=1520 RepID=UPI0022260C7F|nr:RHS repeat-associated core domain-containing protein [Clostridium beijerinckii]UYZ34373.1 hypothetical protein OD350_19190 [Clostridium beijerinckii]